MSSVIKEVTVVGDGKAVMWTKDGRAEYRPVGITGRPYTLVHGESRAVFKTRLEPGVFLRDWKDLGWTIAGEGK